MTDLFLSYSRDDSLVMGVLRDNLRKLGFNLWIDVEHLKPGTPQWSRAVRDAVGQCDGMLVLCSPSTEQSEWVNREVRMARLTDKPIVPILIAGDEWASVPTDLIDTQYVDMRGRSNPTKGFQELVAWLAAEFGSDLPDYSLQESSDLSIPSIQIINVQGHVEGHLITIGGDVDGDLNVAGRDIRHGVSYSIVRLRRIATRIGRLLIMSGVPSARKRWILAGIVVVLTGSYFLYRQWYIATHPITSQIESYDPQTQINVQLMDLPERPTRHIAFASNRDGNFDIYVMDSNGSNLERLTNDPANDLSPSWSPDGRRIAFQSDRDGQDAIYVMNADGSDVKLLTSAPGIYRSPAWSPNGIRIAYASMRDDNFDIYVITADGSNPTPLTDDPADDIYPAWSPDGTQIAFRSDRDNNLEIYVMNADGSDPKSISRNPAADLYPAWSPDGSQIVFISDRDNNQDIYLMEVDGSNVVRLSNRRTVERHPAWSPDGHYIIFISELRGLTGLFTPNLRGPGEIYIMDADGSNIMPLLTEPSDELAPVWQP